MKEIWKDVKDYEGLYMVSNWGNIWSVRRNKKLKFGNKGNYLGVILVKNKIRKNFLVHRLVAEAFIHNPDNLPCVNHKDENPLNNNVENLEWCTYSYNVNYGTRIEKCVKKRSKPVLQYTLDGEFVREWESIAECDRNGFQHYNIIKCCQGKRKKHKDFIWKYK